MTAQICVQISVVSGIVSPEDCAGLRPFLGHVQRTTSFLHSGLWQAK